MGTQRLTDESVEAVLRGRTPPAHRDDLAGLVGVVQAVRASVPADAPTASPELAALLSGASPVTPTPRRTRARLLRRMLAAFTGLGFGVQLGLAAAAATGTLGAAGLADLLPERAQQVFDRFVGREADVPGGPAAVPSESPTGVVGTSDRSDKDGASRVPDDLARQEPVRGGADERPGTGSPTRPDGGTPPDSERVPGQRRTGAEEAPEREGRQAEREDRPEAERADEHETERDDRRERERDQRDEHEDRDADDREADRERDQERDQERDRERAQRERDRQAERAERERERQAERAEEERERQAERAEEEREELEREVEVDPEDELEPPDRD